MDVFTVFGCRNGHRRDSTVGVVGDGRLADAVDRVARGAPEGVVVARQVEVILPFVGAVANAWLDSQFDLHSPANHLP